MSVSNSWRSEQFFKILTGDLFLYADDSCLVYQHKDISKVNKNPIIDKMSIHFREEKPKSIPFSTKQKLAKVGSLDIRYGIIHI